MSKKVLEVKDRIFYEKDGKFYQDAVAEVLTTDEGVLYALEDYYWWCVTEDELLDESDKRVQDCLCLQKDAFVKLSEIRSWLQYHARDYYEADEWSEFKDEDMIKDLCKEILYGQN